VEKKEEIVLNPENPPAPVQTEKPPEEIKNEPIAPVQKEGGTNTGENIIPTKVEPEPHQVVEEIKQEPAKMEFSYPEENKQEIKPENKEMPPDLMQSHVLRMSNVVPVFSSPLVSNVHLISPSS